MRDVYQIYRCPFGLILAGVWSVTTAGAQVPDTIYYNANVITMSPALSTAQALAIRGGPLQRGRRQR